MNLLPDERGELSLQLLHVRVHGAGRVDEEDAAPLHDRPEHAVTPCDRATGCTMLETETRKTTTEVSTQTTSEDPDLPGATAGAWCICRGVARPELRTRSARRGAAAGTFERHPQSPSGTY